MIALESPVTDAAQTDDLQALDLLRIESRLEDGFRKIECAAANGDYSARVERWEAIWLNLLDEYERLYDRLTG